MFDKLKQQFFQAGVVKGVDVGYQKGFAAGEKHGILIGKDMERGGGPKLDAARPEMISVEDEYRFFIEDEYQAPKEDQEMIKAWVNGELYEPVRKQLLMHALRYHRVARTQPPEKREMYDFFADQLKETVKTFDLLKVQPTPDTAADPYED